MGLVSLIAADAHGHIHLVSPQNRLDAQKAGPCGQAGSTRGENVTVLPPGATIEVTWDETVDHPGHFRISFDDDGDDDFADPVDLEDTAPSVLLDRIADTEGGGRSTVAITLPDIECESCTLQLIQVMSVTPPFGSGDFYYQCADLALRAGAPLPDGGAVDPPDGGVDPAPKPISGGCDAGSGEAGWLVLLALIALSLQLRRAARLPAAPQRTTRTRRRRR